MKIITERSEIVGITSAWKKSGKQVVLVPTMGCFHQGHLALMRKGRSLGDKLVVSLFVNPIQFGPNEDLDAYPRPFEEDCRLARENGVDVLFCPKPLAMYPEKFKTKVSVEGVSQRLCGASRPGHFDGVMTVICKLFHLCNADYAVFGEKDFQQLTLIKQLVKDLDFAVEIVPHPIVREADGLAMSSRNKYLTEPQRHQALCLSQALGAAQTYARSSAKPETSTAIEIARSVLQQAGCIAEYIEVVDQNTLLSHTSVKQGDVMALAVRIGDRVRLIDNIVLL